MVFKWKKKERKEEKEGEEEKEGREKEVVEEAFKGSVGRSLLKGKGKGKRRERERSRKGE